MGSQKRTGVTLEWIKSKSGQKYLEKNLNKPVFIRSSNGIWRKNKMGYTDYPECYGVYTLNEAWEATRHCGDEKSVFFRFVDPGYFEYYISELAKKLAYLSETQHRFWFINSKKETKS